MNNKSVLVKRQVVIVVLFSLTFCFGCAGLENKKEKSARDLIMEGMENFNDGRYKSAIESFEKLKDCYPFGRYAILAELKIADSYYLLKKYEDAAFAYEEFENLHPQNEAVPYVIYQNGLCYFERIAALDRDQSAAYKSIEIFDRLIQSYSDSPYAKRGNDNIKQCIRSISEYELYVGKFYFKIKHYKAALKRFKNLLSKYPDTGVHYEAIKYIAECEARF